MYIGTYYHKLEAKNRLSLPAKFRSDLGNSAVVTKGLDGCLFVFDLPTWQGVIKTGLNLPFTKKNNRDFVRLLANSAVEVEIDAQGRILLTEELLKKAELSKNIVVVGSMQRIELWDEQAFRVYTESLEANAESIAESIELDTKET